ncbi:MAG TPA: M56 family metallopeptidase [Pirellulales bacterium]|nr:M56 family metallopeptidase [Pirellulales bacterium]
MPTQLEKYLAEMTGAPFAQFLLDAAAKATVLLLAAIVATALLRRSSAALRHRLWCMTFAALVLLPGLSAALPEWRLAILPYRSPLAPREESGPLAPQANPGSHAAFSLGEQGSLASRDGLPLAEREDDGTPARNGELQGASPVAPPTDAQAAARAPLSMATLWLVGAVLALSPLVAGLARTLLLRRQARPIDSAVWTSLLDELRQRLALARRVGLYETDAALMPMTWGVLRPVVLLPRHAREWSGRPRRFVLLHELAHVKRCDVGFQVLGRLACALYWFHPLVWYALRRLRIERELACDDCVVLAGERATDYAAELLRIARSYRPVPFAAAVAMAQRGNLEHRLGALFDRACSHLPVSARAARLLLAGVMVLVTIVAAVRLAPRASADDDKQTGTSDRAPSESDVDVATVSGNSHGATLGGRVLLPDGKPAAGADLYWARIESPQPGSKLKITKRGGTDGEGRFQIALAQSDLPATVVPSSLVAHKLGFGIAWVEVARGQVPPDITLRLVEDRPIRGRVTDTEGRPVAGARVAAAAVLASRNGRLDAFLTAWKQNWRDSWMKLDRPGGLYAPLLFVVTDDDGRFQLSGVGVERVAEVDITAAGYAYDTLQVVNREGFDADSYNKATAFGRMPRASVLGTVPQLTAPLIEHVVEAELVIRGKVFTGATRAPVAGAVVYAGIGGWGAQVSVTDGAGRYELHGHARNQTVELSVRAPAPSELLDRRWLQRDAAPTEAALTMDVELKRGIVIEGRVFDRTNGKGVEGAVRFVRLPGNDSVDEADLQDAATATGDGGHFRLLVVPGPGVVMAQVTEGPRIDGTEINTYRQASFSQEESQRVPTTIDGDDRYFTGLGGAIDFLTSENAVKVIDVAPNSEPVTCDLPVDPGKTGKIAIEDEQGRPVSDAFVSGLADRWAYAVRIAEPTCTVYGLGPDRPRRVCILHPQRRLAASVTLTGEERGPVKVRLVASATIAGRALDSAGEPIADAFVQIRYARRSASELLRMVILEQAPLKTDRDGRFHVENIVPGERFGLDFRQGDTFFRAPLVSGQRELSGRQPQFAQWIQRMIGLTDERWELKAGQKLEMGDTKMKELR